MKDPLIVTVNKNLNPKLWDKDGNLNPVIKDKLIDIADAFYEFIGVKLNIIDLTITGSNANFTWNAHSDIDLHLVISGVASEQDRELFNAKKAVWGDQHNITIKGIPVEVYVQGNAEVHYSTGVYSILEDDWVVVPKKQKPAIDDAAVHAKKDNIVERIEEALMENDLEKLKSIKEKVVQMRKAGLERAGEWSTENLVFKILRNTGMIEELTTKIHELVDKELSLEHIK
jgi:hypothetical protein